MAASRGANLDRGTSSTGPQPCGSVEQPHGFLSIHEPNSGHDIRVDRDTLRKLRAEEIRATMLPRQLEALDALGVTEEVVDRMLIMEEDDYSEENVLDVEWTDIDVEIALDSGACDHVMDVESDAPGYVITESPSSQRGGGFIVGNGERVPNDGQSSLILEANARLGESQQFRSTFQAARVTRPLMSVSKICSNGFRCVFDKREAQIIDSDDKVVCVCVCVC